MLLQLENGMLLHCYDSDNCLYENGADSCEGYNLFYEDGSYYDGGELDFDSSKIQTEEALLKEIIEFATDQKLNYTILAYTSDCCYESFEELLESEFDEYDLEELIEKVSNESVKARIREVQKEIKEVK